MFSFLAGKAVKATFGAIATAVGGLGTAALAVPEIAGGGGAGEMSVLGYVVVGALNGAVGWATVYFSPANK